MQSVPSRLITVVLVASALLAGAPARAAKPKPLVQKRFVRVTSGTSVSVKLGKPNTAGDLLLAYVVWDNGGAATLADARGNTYASAVGPTQAAGDPTSAQVFYAANVAAGANVVTATFATPIAARAVLYVLEYRGFDHVSPVDATAVNTGSSATMDSGPLTTSALGDLLFAAGESNGRAILRLTRGFKSRGRKNCTIAADAAAATPGTYSVTASQLGSAWVMQLVALRPPVLPPPPPSAFPLKVSANNRYLVDQNDRPFLITGDSPQALMVNLSEAEADAFFADRQASGFNLVWINLLCATYTGGRPDGSTYDGIKPFHDDNDVSTTNEAYFERIDHMLALAAAHGLVVLLDPAETGSFLSVLNASGLTKARNYGRFLGTRYRNVDNIVWMHGNDFQSWPTPGDDAVVEQVARGIRDTDDRHIHTVELDYPVSGSLDDPTWAPLIDLNASYTYYPTYAQVLTDYNRPNAIPTFLVESNYEFEHNAADLGTPEILRRQAYWALLSGAAGQLYGNRYTWPFISGWESQLDTPGSNQMRFVKGLFEPRPWQNLIPDQAHTVVTAGYGTYADGGAMIDNDYLTAARTPDGALVVAYMPTRRTITVDMSQLGSAADASWYDPGDGAYTPIAGSPFANTGTQMFTPPGNNSQGDGDWALVLDASSAPPDGEPPSVPTGLSAPTIGDTHVTIAWAPSTDNVAVAGYRVYRDGGFVHTTLGTSFTDIGLSPSTPYSYTVAAYDYSSNVSDQSAPLVVTTTAPAPTLVQQAYATPQPPQASVSVIYAGAQTTGNANILAIGWNDTTASIATVADTAGNVYQPAVATFRGNGLSQAIYYASNIAAAAAGANHVTVTFDQAAQFVDLRITEYAHVRHATPFDAGASSSGNGTAATSGNVSTGTASELLFAAGMTGTTFTAAGTGYTVELITAPDGDLIEDAVSGAPGSYGAAAALGSGTWLLQLAAFVGGP